MLTSKQRAYLRGLASKEDTIMQIGKSGISENLIKTISDALEARELIKLRVLENSEESPRSAAEALAEATGADVVTVIGTILAIFASVNKFEGFLYFIGSVFAPMIAIQLADFFVLKRNCEAKALSIVNLVIWFAGFIIYRIFMNIDFAVGCTLPAMTVTFLLALIKGR